MDTKKVWFVTGASKGLGLSLVKKLLSEGYKVAATSRSADAFLDETETQHENFLQLQMNPVNEQSVANAIADSLKAFGTIDVVVNNAGYGQLGTLEELSDKEARENFDANVFGSLNVIRCVMPHLREKKSGAIFNISSIGGFLGSFPGWGIYCASKFAVVGFTESLAEEAKEFGITATVVYPGYFRTNFLEKGSLHLPQNPIAGYAAARDVEELHVNEIKGNQPGDPDKAAVALIQLAESKTLPVHFFMGSDSYEMAKNKIEMLQNELKANETLSMSTNFQQ